MDQRPGLCRSWVPRLEVAQHRGGFRSFPPTSATSSVTGGLDMSLETILIIVVIVFLLGGGGWYWGRGRG